METPQDKIPPWWKLTQDAFDLLMKLVFYSFLLWGLGILGLVAYGLVMLMFK